MKLMNAHSRFVCSFVSFLCASIVASAVHAEVHSPRALSPHNADVYSMKTFAQFHRWRDLNGDAKVYEIFKYLADPRTGIYPLGVPALEGRDSIPEFAAVRDPVKMLNVYTIGHCGTLGPTMAGIMRDMGIGKSRTVMIPGWGHVASEVFYDGKWHYLDLDVRAVFRREDGSLASMEEAKKDDALWKGTNTPLFFPLDRLSDVRKAYAETRVEDYYGFSTGGHTMDYVLRPGETFTRWWTPQGGRWNHHPSYGAKPFPRSVIEGEPRGPKCKHASFTVHTHGNGRFVYKPNLTSKSSDFEDGVYDARNVQPGEADLTLQQPGEGYAIFEVRTPYVIVPLVGDMDTTADDREASVVRINAEGVTLSLSLDNGLTWKELGAAAGAVDLTPHVSGRYGYLLKLTLKGEAQKAVVRSLEMTTWVQLHPASLPSLRKGRNEMQFVTGDHYGLPTRAVEIRTNGSDREDFLKYLVQPPPDFDPARFTNRARGPFIAQVQAPPGTKIAWFSAGGNFTAHQAAAAPQTKNSMAYAVDAPRDFKEFYKADVPAGNAHWHTNADVEVKLDAPANTVYLRYVGDPGVNNLRIYAHCIKDKPSASAPVTITHAWRERGQLKTKTVALDKPGRYEIIAEDDPVDEFIELSVPSAVRR